MPRLDLVAEHFVVADRRDIRRMLCDRALWRRWFPDLVLEVSVDRGPEGVRWRVSGAFEGSAEVWVEEYGDGAVTHLFLRLETAGPGTARRLERRYGVPLRRHLFDAKDALEGDRPPGVPRRIGSTAAGRGRPRGAGHG